ncbi:dTMP kinase [Myxococcaceae bacterium GXIMD 01537]
MLEAASRGLVPDRVFLMDVDPALARGRRRISKLLAPVVDTPSRKGLAGTGLQVRLREGYRALAAESPERWTLLENAGVTLDALVLQVVRDIRQMLGGAELPPRAPRPPPPPARTLEAARERFLQQIDIWAREEPRLAAYFLSGLSGADMTERRRMLAASCPELVAHSLAGLTDEASWSLRDGLAEAAPGHVLGSLADLASDCPAAWGLRERLMARAPREAAASLEGLDSEPAWSLRARLVARAPEAVVASLEGLDGERAWAERLRWISEVGGDGALSAERTARTACRSLRRLDSVRAWAWRQRAWAAVPDAVLRSVEGLESPRAWELRERHGERAPKAMLPTLAGLNSPRAWALRESFGTRCEEVLDSMEGLDSPEAWALRETLANTWPAATVRSLGPLLLTPRGRALAEELLVQHPQDFALLRQAARGAPDTSQDPAHASV